MKYILKDLITKEEEKFNINIYDKYEIIHKIAYYLDIERPFKITYDYLENKDFM